MWNFVNASATGEVTKICTSFSVLLPGNGQHGKCEGASVGSFHSNRDLDYRFIGYEGARGGVVVKALCYKPTGRGFDS